MCSVGNVWVKISVVNLWVKKSVGKMSVEDPWVIFVGKIRG